LETVLRDFSILTAKRSISLRANVLWAFSGTLVYSIAQWGTLASISKLGTPYMVGQFALGLAVSAPVYMFTNMQLRTLQATDAKGIFSFPDYFGLRVLASAAALAFIILLATVNSGLNQTQLVVIAIGGTKCLESLSDAVYGLCQKHERMRFISASLCVKGIGSVAALILVLRLTRNLFEATCAIAVWWLLLFVCVDLRWAARLIKLERPHPRKWLPHFERRTLARLFLIAFPMGIQTMLASLAMNIPRYVIDRDLGTAMLGKFAAMAYFIVAGHTVIAAVSNSVQAPLSRCWHSSLPAFRTLVFKCGAFAFGVGLTCTIIAAVAGKAILTVCYNSEYATHQGVFVLLMFSAGFLYVGSILGGGVAIVRRFWTFTLLYLSVPLLTLVIAWLLVPKLGLIGAAFATLVYCIANAVVPIAVIASAYREEALERVAHPFSHGSVCTTLSTTA
jgi:O-antigen/teichoic acid export membrane protein